MNYFQSYSLPADAGVVAAWDSEIARAKEVPPLARLIAERGAELYPEFAKRYAEVRALPRSARRALQKRLAKSRDLAAIPAKWQRRLAYSIAGAALLLAMSGAAQAGTINVTPKTPPGLVVPDGRCSLTEAIISANNGSSLYGDCPGATASPNTINVAGSQTLTAPYDYFYGYNTGLPLITSTITIQGNKTKITRSKTAPLFRHFAVNGSGDLTLNNVTLSGGASPYGGSIFNFYGSVTLNSCVVTGNVSIYGGAIDNVKGYLALNDSILSRNLGYYGGAIYNSGGDPGPYGDVVMHHTLVTGNLAKFGGGIFSKNYYADLYIYNSTLSKNAAYYDGGAIFNYSGSSYLKDSLSTGNRALRYGGGLFSMHHSTTVNHSSFTKNLAGVDGGGIFVYDDDLTLTNSSVTGNKAGRYGGGVEIILSGYSLSGNSVIKNRAGVYGNDYYIFP
jgi:hypothetical protein